MQPLKTNFESNVKRDFKTLVKMAATPIMECGDFLEFKDTLQKMRQIDDKIIYMLNTTIPTDSFKGQIDPQVKCKDLFEQIQSGHSQREQAIKQCLSISRQRVRELKSRKEAGEENTPQLIKTLRKEQNTLRLLESELVVEDIVQKRTSQVYYEKCRRFYKPSDIEL